MSEDFDDWNPMGDDFQSTAFNSYSSDQTAAHLSHNLTPVFGSEFETRRSPKLYIDGFPLDLTETGLKNFLNRIGCKALSLKIVNSRKSIGKRFSFVDFESVREAQRAVELLTSQKFYKLSVRFASTQSDRQKREDVIEREKQCFQSLITKQFEMKSKMETGNRSAINCNSNGDHSSVSPVQSESESQDSSHFDLLSPLAKSDKLLKILERPEDDCSFCSHNNLEHLHFILSEQQVLDPNQLPALIDMKNTCLSCGRIGVDMKLCSQCKAAIYCNVKCQSSHWPRHRVECKQDLNTSLNLNSTLNSSKLLNGNNSNERIVERMKTVSKPMESSITEKVNAVTQKTKMTPQIRVTPKESVIVTSDPRESGDQVDSALRTVAKEPEAPKHIESIPTKQVIKSAVTKEQSPQKATEVMTKEKKTIETEVLTDGEVGVVLCFGRDPFDFYLQKASAADSMDIFADEIIIKKDVFPQLKDTELRKGVLCGGIYSADDSCYRARIEDKVNDDIYALYFLDYGNTEPVNKKDIKRLPDIFFSCKAQAIHCTLDKLVPKNKEWSKDAIALFGEMGENNEYTKVKIIGKTSDGKVKVDLLNKKGESIGNRLVEKGFASFGDELSESSTKSIATPKPSPKRAPPTPINSESPLLVQSSPKVTFNKSSIDNMSVNYKTIPKLVLENNCNDTELTLKSFIEKLSPHSELSVMVTNAYNAENFQYFGTVFDSSVQDVIVGLAADYPSQKATVTPKVGDIVVVQGSDDECYRSYVLELEPKGAKVFMFDSGFVETVSNDKIYKLFDKYNEFPVYGVLLTAMTPMTARFIELSQTNETTIDGILLRRGPEYILKKDDFLIDLKDFRGMIDFVKNCEEAPAPQIEEKGDPFFALPLRQLELKKSIEAFALYQETDNPKVFYIAGDADDCTKLMTLCSEYSLKYDNNIRVNPLQGEVYLVRSSDNEWYRAVVYSVNEEKVRVKYIDFGNEEEIDGDHFMELCGDIQISKIPPLAIKCIVSSTKLSDEELNTKIQNATEGAYLLKIEVIKIEDNIHYVKVK